ncbi:MAG: helix-turn-helix transcriptional regulator [Clostridia bacterium]|nr:helix-turn-helix transcriptional regulator [Clostridia bacterium]
MNSIVKRLGQRIRNYRTNLGLSQEKLAELAGCHPTYIGQIERGEKNATIESLEKISSALGVSLSKLFEKIGSVENSESGRNIPLECYELLSSQTPSEQEQILKIIIEMVKYKNDSVA